MAGDVIVLSRQGFLNYGIGYSKRRMNLGYQIQDPNYRPTLLKQMLFLLKRN